MDKKKPRKYTEEFKRQAVQLAKDLGSAKKAASQLGIGDANIYFWRMKIETGQALECAASKQNKVVPTIPTATSVEEENRRLRMKVAELEKVNYVLKAAAAIFTRDHLS